LDARLVAGLVRTSAGVSRGLAYATDVLDAAAGLEGLPPRLDGQGWSETVAAARAVPEGEPPAHLAPLERLAGSARGQGEDLLAVALQLAAARMERLAFILQQYGDAAARGQDVLRDATTGLRRALENASVDAPRAAGLQGAFTASALDQQARATDLLAHAAGKTPAAPVVDARPTPAPGPCWLLAAGALAALVLGARRPRR
jgi:hypothetical protein